MKHDGRRGQKRQATLGACGRQSAQLAPPMAASTPTGINRQPAGRCQRRVQLACSPAQEQQQLKYHQLEPPSCVRYKGGGGSGSNYASSLGADQTLSRLASPRLSLLGKPICWSSHKAQYRDTRSMRWKKRLRAFLEQPQGLLPWLYHSSL